MLFTGCNNGYQASSLYWCYNIQFQHHWETFETSKEWRLELGQKPVKQLNPEHLTHNLCHFNPKCHYLLFTDQLATQPTRPRPILFAMQSSCQWRNLFGSILFLMQNSCYFWMAEESVRIYFICSSNPDIIVTSILNSHWHELWKARKMLIFNTT